MSGCRRRQILVHGEGDGLDEVLRELGASQARPGDALGDFLNRQGIGLYHGPGEGDIGVLVGDGGDIGARGRRFIVVCHGLGIARIVVVGATLDDDYAALVDEKLPGPQVVVVAQAGGGLVAAAGDGGRQEETFRLLVDAAGDGARARGMVASGAAERDMRVRLTPGGQVRRIVQVDAGEDDRDGQDKVWLELDRPAAHRVGDIIAVADNPAMAADQFEARLVWFGEHQLLAGRAYDIAINAQVVAGSFSHIKYVIDADNLDHIAAPTVHAGEVAVANMAVERDIAFAEAGQCRRLAWFAVREHFSGEEVGCGVVNFALRRASNVHRQALDVDKQARAQQLGQKPTVVWFTGLSGSGKSAVANAVEKRLHGRGHLTYTLDGDNVRHGLNRDLGFTEADRVENIRRVAEIAKLMVDAGLIVLVSFISPFRAERAMARDMLGEDEFIEVYMDTPLEVCEERDEKGLYARARRGEIKNFTGIDSPYEPPERADIVIDTVEASIDEAAEEIIAQLAARKRLG